jgi:hypothetical protein
VQIELEMLFELVGSSLQTVNTFVSKLYKADEVVQAKTYIGKLSENDDMCFGHELQL